MKLTLSYVLQAPANIKHQTSTFNQRQFNNKQHSSGDPMGCDKDMIVLKMKCVRVCVCGISE